MRRHWRLWLILIALISFGIALSYPVIYRQKAQQNDQTLSDLARLREEILEQEGEEAGSSEAVTDSEETAEEKPVMPGSEESPDDGPESEETEAEPRIEDYLIDYVPGMTWRQITVPELEELDAPSFVGEGPKAVTDRSERRDGLPYPMKEKITLDETKILPELKEIYALNQDLVGWIRIEGTAIDYPVVQRPEDNEYYLTHDFFGEENINGQIILDAKCDPYTPSYNLVISGHHMRNGSMFAGLAAYKDKAFRESHKTARFDTLMRRGTYLIIAAFYSADYDEYEEGFRYNADLQYRIDVNHWLAEVKENTIYETDMDAGFGDEFLTLTTCDHSRRDDGRFVLILRRVREGESIE